jgi:multiple sugar transport system permease protein
MSLASAIRHPALRQRGPVLSRLFLYLLMAVLGWVFVAPLLFMFVGSVKPNDLVLGDGSSWRAFVPIPFHPNFADAVAFSDFYQLFRNSVIISGSVVLGGVLINSLAGYSLARLRFPGRKALITIVVILLIIPFQVVALPILLLMSWAGLVDTYIVQIVPFLASPFLIFFFYTFFLTLPTELDEAARLDGAGPFTIYWRIMLPMSGPAIATSIILGFLFNWGELFWPLMVTRGIDVRPVTVGLTVIGSTRPVQWGEFMAVATMITLPILVVFIVFQRAFVRSVATSGIRG